MEALGKPYIRIYTAQNGQKYLSVAVHMGDKLKLLKSFGNVADSENWDKAIEFELDALRSWYKTLKQKYCGSR